jgi:CubicO group peptidase (beta-lactamase class C family)
VIGILCEAKALQKPGHRPGYHALTGGYVLAEILQRVTGTPVKTFLENEVLKPLGFRDFTYGIEPSRILEVAENAYTGLPPLPPGSWVLERSLGIDLRDAIGVSNDPRFLTAVVPSGNIICTAEEACRFFQLLLDEGELDGVRIFRPSTVRRAVEAISRFSVDAFIGLPVRYGMGFMVGGRFISPYGHHSKNAFGHLGFTNTLAWADPDRDLSACIMTSGKPFLTPGQVPWLMVPRTIARVCGMTPRRRLHATE